MVNCSSAGSSKQKAVQPRRCRARSVRMHGGHCYATRVMRWRRRGWCCVLLVMASSAGATSSSITERGNNAPLRAVAVNHESERGQEPPPHERMHVIRRLYGKHAAGVRQTISDLLDAMPRYQTGVPPDPHHVVPYDHHPFELLRQQRELQTDDGTAGGDDGAATITDDGNTDDAAVSTDDDASSSSSSSGSNSTYAGSAAAGSRFQPMRVHFVTDALDSMMDGSSLDAKIEWYKNTILPATASFWSQSLSVVPVSGNLQISADELANRAYCGDEEFTEVPSDHISDGVPNVDLILYVSGTPSTRFCPDRTLAVAVPCNFDQYDRPTAGAINVCLDALSLQSDGTAKDSVRQDYIDVTIHETAHVLGMSSNSYRFFWDPDTGLPRTTRPFSATTVTCITGEERTLIMPADNTLQFGTNHQGSRYATIVTPKVRTVARNQFDCQSLEGGQLENQETRADSCTGDHWDERLYYPEAMSAVISPTTNIVSSLTLALFDDAGWYRANYTMSKMSPWGLGAGCDFVQKPCLTQASDGSGPVVPEYSNGFFCNQAQKKACSPELTHKMACTVIDYYYLVPQELPPSNLQFFLDAPTKGGPRQADYCPVFGSTYDNKDGDELDCRVAANGDSSFNLHSEVYGSGSQCIPSTSGEGRCYRTACIKSDMVLQINVAGEWLTCEYDFQRIELSVVDTGGFPQTLICPRLSQACPDLFCPFNCAGRGVCNYSAVVNGTQRPTCECFDSSDTSEGCSDSQIPAGDFLDNSNGLINNLEQNFFDPLVSVFVDSMDKWSTASWVWAAGLVTVCGVLMLCICSSFLPDTRKRVPRSGSKRMSARNVDGDGYY